MISACRSNWIGDWGCTNERMTSLSQTSVSCSSVSRSHVIANRCQWRQRCDSQSPHSPALPWQRGRGGDAVTSVEGRLLQLSCWWWLDDDSPPAASDDDDGQSTSHPLEDVLNDPSLLSAASSWTLYLQTQQSQMTGNAATLLIFLLAL